MSKATDKQPNNNGRDAKGRFLPDNKEGFLPGVSGNPKGRPPRKTFIEDLLAELDNLLEELDTGEFDLEIAGFDE